MIETSIDHILYLAVVSLIAVAYSRMRPVVILPALMLGSLLGRALGLGIPDLLVNLSPFALALLVFVAGIELDVDFIRKEKERIFLFIFFEASFIIALYGFLRSLMNPAAALTLIAIMVASNEAFAYEYRKVDSELANYGIAISILEDSLAVFLASLGFFTLGIKGLSREAIYGLIAWSVVALAVAIILAKWIGRILKGAEEGAKILTLLLYILILSSISNFLHLPEALVIFIGAISMAIQGLDKSMFELLEGLMNLALMGFVMTLPYEVYVPELPVFEVSLLYLRAVLIGFVLSILAYAFRAIALFAASFLSGMEFIRGMRLTIVMANTGEFGLLVLATLLAKGVELPNELALGAMFAYAFNLTYLNVLSKRADDLVNIIMIRAPKPLMDGLLRIHGELSDLINYLISDFNFKRHIYQLALIISLTYLLSFLFNLRVGFHEIILIALFSSILAAVFVIFRRIAIDIRRISGLRVSLAFSLLTRLLTLYVTLLPLLSIADELFSGGIVFTFSNPLSLISAVVLSAGILMGSDKIVSKLEPARPTSER